MQTTEGTLLKTRLTETEIQRIKDEASQERGRDVNHQENNVAALSAEENEQSDEVNQPNESDHPNATQC